MFEFDSFREILATIRKNKMRTLLTGFSVAWGIFMLIILLASGNGLRNGVSSNFAGRATNSVGLWPGYTSMPYKGTPKGRRIRFTEGDMLMLRSNFPEIGYLSGIYHKEATLSYKGEFISLVIDGVHSDIQYIDEIKIESGKGRFVNQLDQDERRKVLVLHPNHVKVLFKGGEDPIGKYVSAGEISYKVIGVYSTLEEGSDNSAYAPLSLVMALYSAGEIALSRIDFTVNGIKNVAQSEAFMLRVREQMAILHSSDPSDRSSLWVWNRVEQSIETNQMFSMINLFVLLVGLASLMAGVVGVSNIMLITVKERTREIGIRKSLGANPFSVLWLIIMESVFITTCAGYVGIVFGVGLTELVNMVMERGRSADSEGFSAFLNPTVDLGTVIWATLFLIACGVVAGAIPAYKATRVSPIEAMRAE